MSQYEKTIQLNVSPKITKSKIKKRRLINYIIELISKNNKLSKINGRVSETNNKLSKNHHVKENESVVCPYCHSTNCIKNGKNNHKQRYFCKLCNKSYMTITNTVIYHTRKSVSVWKRYVECLINQYSLRQCAAMLNMDLKTAFFWRHKILAALEEQLEVGTLSGEIQMNTIYVKRNFKGNHKKSSFPMPRESYKRGPGSIEELIYHDYVCVMGAMNNSGSVVMKPICVNTPKVDNIITSFRHIIAGGDLLITEAKDCYREFAQVCEVQHVPVKKYSTVNNGYNLRPASISQ